MKQLTLTLIAFVLILQACDKGDGYKETDTGLKYKFHIDKEGETAKEGDIVHIRHRMKTEGDSVLVSTFEGERGVEFPLSKPSFKGDLIEGLMMLSEGDSATFKVRADSVFGGNMPEFFDTGGYVLFDVKMEQIQSQEEYRQEKQAAGMQQREKDIEQIKKYVSGKNLNTQETPSGIHYIIENKGSGPAAEPGKTVKVNYTGYMLDGTVFDSSIESVAKEAGVYIEQRPYEPIEVRLGEGNVIPGWEEGITLFNEGGKGKIIIPSYLAYGPQRRSDVIGPNSILIFDIEVVDVEG